MAPVALLVVAGAAWLVAESLYAYGGPLIAIALALPTAAGLALRQAWLASPHAISLLQRVSAAIVIAMMAAYAMAFYAVSRDVFLSAPYFIISAIYASVACLISGLALLARHRPARVSLIAVLIGFSLFSGLAASVIIELLVEVPAIVEDYRRHVSQLQFYNALALLFIVLGAALAGIGLMLVALAGDRQARTVG